MDTDFGNNKRDFLKGSALLGAAAAGLAGTIAPRQGQRWRGYTRSTPSP
jgi:hypothetical protein